MADSDWRYFYGDGEAHPEVGKSSTEAGQKELEMPTSPPWRKFRDWSKMEDKEKEEIKNRWEQIQKLAESDENERGWTKGKNFRLPANVTEPEREEEIKQAKAVLNAVNAGLYLRRPLLVTGRPGSGKTSLAYAIAYELKLGPVLTWPITARSTLEQGLYRYDAIARLQEAERIKRSGEEIDTEKEDIEKETEIGNYLELGPVGTAFLPWQLPRVLLIDEIDKSDINLPNDLLNLFEEGVYEIQPLIRRERSLAQLAQSEAEKVNLKPVRVRMADPGIEAEIYRGRVRCCAFPIVIMTSNGERDFPPAFKRRCLRVRMPDPKKDALQTILKAHFNWDDQEFAKVNGKIVPLIDEFVKEKDRSTDQLLNIVYLLAQHVSEKEPDREQLMELLLKRLSTEDL
jgi:MoxR-like ATPase